MVNKANNNLVNLFRGDIELDDEIHEGYYRPGDMLELDMYLTGYGFLLDSVPTVAEFVIKNSK